MSQPVFSIHQNLEELGLFFSASKGMDLPSRPRSSRQREPGFFFRVLYIGCKQKVQVRLKVNLLTSKDLIRNPSQLFLDVVKLTTKNSHPRGICHNRTIKGF